MNRDLFWKLLEAEHPKAIAFCRRLTANKDDGDDLYHESLVRAYSKRGKLQNDDSFRPWLYKIIVNKYKSNCRRLKWFCYKPQTNISQAHDPSGRLDAGIWLRRVFRALTAEERALISLYEMEGWSIRELAQLQGKPVGTIKSKLSRARLKMRSELGRYLSRGETQTITNEADYAMPRSETSIE